MSFSVPGLESLFSLYKEKVRTTNDALVLFLHWYLVQNGFKCTRNDGKLSEILPEDWFAEEQVYLIKYTKDGKGYELKVLVVDEHLMIHLARLKDERVASLTIKAANHVNNIQNEFEGVYKNLQDFYEKLKNEFDLLIKSPVKVETEKEKKVPVEEKIRSSERAQATNPLYINDPLRVRNPYADRVPPVNIGRSDLDPFYVDPLGGGGMIFDPFRTGGARRPIIPTDLPPGAVPPGARFDPFQPPNPDAIIPGSSRFEPNPDHLQKPPGYDDMFM